MALGQILFSYQLSFNLLSIRFHLSFADGIGPVRGHIYTQTWSYNSMGIKTQTYAHKGFCSFMATKQILILEISLNLLKCRSRPRLGILNSTEEACTG